MTGVNVDAKNEIGKEEEVQVPVGGATTGAVHKVIGRVEDSKNDDQGEEVIHYSGTKCQPTVTILRLDHASHCSLESESLEL